MQKKHPITTKRSYLLILFGLPFFLVGVGFLFWSVIPTFYDHVRMQSWPSVRGQLTYANSQSSSSDGTITYQTDATYTYRVGHIDYTHDRVAINSGGDNIGDFQRKLGRHLEDLYEQKAPVIVFYDRDNPKDAILNRDLRGWLLAFKMIFVLIFGGAGAGLMYWGYRGKKTIQAPDAADKPWLARPEWQNGVIRSNAKTGVIATWVFAIIWNLISTPATFQFSSIWDKEGAVALLILLFPLVGMAALYWAIKLTREWKRFGATPLTLDPFPGSFNGDVAGEIQLKLRYQPDMTCKVTLSNIHSTISGSGKNSSRKENVLWQQDGYARIKPSINGTVLQFRFEVPGELKESEEMKRSYHLWRLNIELSLDGIDMDRSFEIPVYDTGMTSRRITIDSSHERPAGLPKMTAETLLPLSQQGGTTIIHYPILRNPGHSIKILIFGSFFAGTGAFLWTEAANEGFMLYVMSAIFSLAGGAIVVAGFYSAFNSLHVRLDGRTLSTARSFLGIVINHSENLYGNILAIESKQGMKSNSGGKHTIEYSISANVQGKKITLAEQLDSTQKRDVVIGYFKSALKKH